MAEVKAAALKGMYEYLRDLLGVLIALDDTHVDIHPELPACSTPDLRIDDVYTGDKSIIMVVWPKATPGNTTMPSPIIDALRSAAAELARITGRLATLELLVEKSKSKREGSSPTPTLPPTNVEQDSAPEDNGGIVWECLMTEGRISEALKAEDALLATRARILEAERAQIWAEKAELLNRVDA
ncbi:hypothetical protein BD779DRAFT_1679081 [Infundibulicybe gibba]|nr:hypothetical protein BD779DRAFT_1679081 [Infundibulicybe gibba]